MTRNVMRLTGCICARVRYARVIWMMGDLLDYGYLHARCLCACAHIEGRNKLGVEGGEWRNECIVFEFRVNKFDSFSDFGFIGGE